MNESGIIKILELLGSKKVKKIGQNILASCPIGTHADKNPSFTMKINPGGPSSWHCYSCGEKANRTVSLLYKVRENGGGWNDEIHRMIKNEEYDSPEYTFNKLQDWNSQKQSNLNKRYNQGFNHSGYTVSDYEGKFNEEDYAPVFEQIPQYALDRGFTIETCKRWKLGYERFHYPFRLFIPIYSHEGKMVGYSGRLINKKDEQYSPKYKHAQYFKKEKYLYGEHLINHEFKTCFITESFMDVINLDQMGLPNSLAIMGTGISSYQAEKVKRWFDRAVIFPHNDKEQLDGSRPGQKMAEDCKYRLEQAGVKVIIAPYVPHKRQIGDEIKSPQDAGEWNLDDLKWVLKVIKEADDGSSETGEETEETRREKKEIERSFEEKIRE